MKNSVIKILITTALLVFISNPIYSYRWSLKKNKAIYHFVDHDQVPFISSKSYSPRIEDNINQNNNFDKQPITKDCNSNFFYQDYAERTPFQESNVYASSIQNQSQQLELSKPIRHSRSSTNDDDLPGDPGQMPISDGGTVFAFAIVFYILTKSRFTKK